jgi:type I restriction enzyme S subunit
MSNSVPDRWSVKSIGELVTLQYGKSPKDIFSEDGEYPVIGTGGVTGSTSAYLHEGGTTVIGRKGTINKPSYVDGRFWAIDTTYFGDNYRDTDPKWFYYSLNSFDLAKYNEASGVPSLNRDTLNAIQLLKPPLPEQQKIATILSSVDDVIERTRAQIDKLKDLKTGMMQELLTKGIGSGGVPHTEFKDSPVGRIPVGWNVSKVGDVTQKFQNGYAFSASGYVDEGVPIVSMAFIGLDGNFNTHYSKTRYWDASQVDSLERYLVKNGDLLIAMTDVTPTMELIGRCCIARVNRDHLLNQRVGLIRLDASRVDKLFFSYYSNHDIWRDYARGMSGLGAQANLGTSQIADGMIPLPPLQEQIHISSILQSVDKLIEEKRKRVSIGQAQKKALMQDLLTGKVRVNTDQRESVVA